jgi:hypothetical protein
MSDFSYLHEQRLEYCVIFDILKSSKTDGGIAMKLRGLTLAAALLAAALFTGCAAREAAEPSGTAVAVSPTDAAAASAPAAAPDESPAPDISSTPDLSPKPTFGYISTPSKELTAFAETLKPHTVADPENALNPEWRYPLAGIDSYAGTDLTYDEFTALIGGLEELSEAAEVTAGLTREKYDARPSNWVNDAVLNLAQKPVRADLNGDGVSELVVVTRTGGGSEGGSVLVYAEEKGQYRQLLNFYIGMQNVFALTQCGDHYFLVVGFVSHMPIDATPGNDVSPGDTFIGYPGYAVRHFGKDWTPECIVVENGTTSIPEYDWFWGVDLTGEGD